jgi:putative MATE family efflux protein
VVLLRDRDCESVLRPIAMVYLMCHRIGSCLDTISFNRGARRVICCKGHARSLPKGKKNSITWLQMHSQVSHNLGIVCITRARAIDASSLGDNGDEESRIRMDMVWQKIVQIVQFALPVLMIPIADPIMSLIDTIFLGQFSGSLHLAALSPCTLIFNFAFYSFTALTIATVSIIADKLRLGQDAGAGQALSTSLLIGAVGGSLITLILVFYGPQLLIKTGCDPVLLPIAETYLSIRAFSIPAAIMTSVLLGSFLAQRNSKTPFSIVITSILLSALGDFLLMSMFDAGIAAAAWTTLVSQYFSSMALLYQARRGKSRAIPRLSFPAMSEVISLLKYVSTLGVFYVAKTSSYLFLQASATRLPATSLAAHQVIWTLWGLCSFTNAPLEQASLAFLPIAKPGRDKNELTVALLCTGGLLGILCSAIAVGIPAMFPSLLTSDATLWPIMQSVWAPGLASMLCCGVDVTSTGILLANRDTGYVAKAMLFSLVTLISWLYASFKVFGSCRIELVWYGLTAFFVSRLVQSFPRVVTRHIHW